MKGNLFQFIIALLIVVSIVAAVNFTTTGFAPLPPPETLPVIDGDWIINETDDITFEDDGIILTGNLIVNGKLTLDNATLLMDCAEDGGCGINVAEYGGCQNNTDWLYPPMVIICDGFETYCYTLGVCTLIEECPSCSFT